MKLRGFIITLIALFALLIARSQANGQTTDPAAQLTDTESVYRAEYEAQNAGDTSAAGFAEDVVSIAVPAHPVVGAVVGKAAVQKITEEVVAAHAYVDLRDFHVNGDSATFTVLVTADFFRDIGITEPLEHRGLTVVRNGLIQFEAWVMTEESQVRFNAALARQERKAIVDRLYTEVINQKNVGAIDEIYADDVVGHGSKVLDAQTVKANLTAFLTGFPDLQATADYWISEGDLITVHATFSGTHQGEWAGAAVTGKAVSWTQIDIYRLDNGKIVEIWQTVPTADILQQLGYQLVPPTQ